MTPTLRAELDRIEEFLLGPEGRELATILSALRGPDIIDNPREDNLTLKSHTTSHIRYAAFPKLMNNPEPTYGMVLDGKWSTICSEKLTIPKIDYNSNDYGKRHFIDHIRLAAEVLGLTARTDQIS